MAGLPPLRRALAWRFAAASLLPILAASLLIVRHFGVDTIEEIAERNRLLAHAVSGQVEGFLHEPMTTLRGLRETLDTAAAAAGTAPLLDAAVRGSGLIESVYLLDPRGRVAAVGLKPEDAGLRRDYLGLDLAHHPVRQAIRSGASAAWSDTFLSILSGKMSLSFGLPAGAGTLLANFEIGRLAAFTERFEQGGQVRVSIVDRSGALIVNPDPLVSLRQVKVGHIPLVQRGLAGEEGTERLTFLGRRVIASVARIPGPGWVVLVAQTTADAYSDLRRAAVLIAGGVLLTVALAILFTLTQARAIAGPLADFAAQARTVAGGGYDFRPPESGTLEVRELARSFRQMTEAVREREQRLRESEEKYRLLVENAGDAVFVAEGERLRFANRRMEELAGRDAGDLAARPWTGLVHPDDRAALREGEPAAADDAGRMAELRLVRPSGEERWAQMNSVPVPWEGRPATLHFVRDVTDQRALEAQLRQGQKMEAVGTLAGGIAHDFNNLLQAIQGYAELGLLPGRTAEDSQRAFREIAVAAGRGADLTRQLLTFSRKIESRRRPVDLGGEIASVCAMLEHTLPKMVRIECEVSPGVPAVEADPSQLQQVLMNLALNARDAMPGGGTLRFAAGAEEIAAPDPAHPEVAPGRYAVLEVSDTGSGIGEGALGHIFEPFFTTKEAGRGTGLGLAMVYGIVKAHEGHIFCESAPGRGARFRILLPAGAAPAPRAASEARPAAATGRERVLLVDDEEAIRSLGSEILADSGYRVRTAPDAETALRICREEPGAVDLVVLDLIMPGMGGKRCLEELLRLDPTLRVLVTSGYADGEPVPEVLDLGARGFLGKPFSLQSLLEAVRAALGPPGRPGATRPPAAP